MSQSHKVMKSQNYKGTILQSYKVKLQSNKVTMLQH